MSLTDEAKRMHAAIKDGKVREEIQSIASRDNISFNAAMKKYFSDK